MAELLTPFDAKAYQPWRGDGSWYHVERKYAYVIEDGDPVPIFPELPIGLVGEIAAFIEAKAPRPNRMAAIAGALGLTAGIVGRAYNVEGSGCNENFVILAPSSSGKESANKGAEILMNAVVPKVPNAAGFIGPGDVSSKAALQRYVSRAKPPCFVMFIGEFGEWLAPIVSPRASEARQSLRKMLLDLSEKGGAESVLRKSAYADAEKNIEDVFAPAVSIVGDSVPETFFENVTEQNTGNGFFARFVILQSEERVAPLNKDHALVRPSPQLVEELSALCSQALNLNTMNAAETVGVSAEARFELDDFCRRCDDERDAATDNYKRAVWGRGYVHALRIAAILAVGRNPFLPTIDVCDASWSVALVTCSIEKLLCKFEDGEVGDVSQSEVARLNEVKRVIAKYLKSQWSEVAVYSGNGTGKVHADKVVPYGYVQRSVYKLKPFKDAAFGKTSDAIKQTLRIMVERGELVEISCAVMSKDYDYSGVAYGIARPGDFLE